MHRTVWRLAPSSLFFCGALLFSLFNNVNGQTSDDIIFTPEKIKTIPGHGMSKAEYPYDEGGTYRTEWVNPSARSKVKSSVTVRSPISPNSKEHSNFLAKQRLANASKPKQATNNNNSKRSNAIEVEMEKRWETPLRSLPKKAPPPKKMVSRPKPAPVSPPPPPAPAPIRMMSDDEAKAYGFIGPFVEMYKQSWNAPQPRIAARKPAPAQKPVAAEPKRPIYHKVDVGDTLFNISKKYGVTVDSLKRANGLTSDLIKVGQSLRLALAQRALGM